MNDDNSYSNEYIHPSLESVERIFKFMTNESVVNQITTAMSNELKITKGEWKLWRQLEEIEPLVVIPDDGSIPWASKSTWIMVGGVIIGEVKSLTTGMFCQSFFEFEANAKFIVDAGNVANETGKTPRQLAEENKMLLEALKNTTNELKFSLANQASALGMTKRGIKDLINANSVIVKSQQAIEKVTKTK